MPHLTRSFIASKVGCFRGNEIPYSPKAPIRTPKPNRDKLNSMPATYRLRKHADYQRVYKAGRKQFARQISYFYSLRPEPPAESVQQGPRIGLTVGKPLGKAVDRNRIKRRLREVVRRNVILLDGPVDLILHPRRSVKDLEFKTLEREVIGIFRSVQRSVASGRPSASGKALAATQVDPPLPS